MPRTPTDYRTYPDDRPTRLTPAQRAAKRAKAARLLADAADLLAEVSADFDANGYRLPADLLTEWRDVAHATDQTRAAARALTEGA